MILKNKKSNVSLKALFMVLLVIAMLIPATAYAAGVRPGSNGGGDSGSIEPIDGDLGSLVPSQGGLPGVAGDSGRKQGWIESICFNPA